MNRLLITNLFLSLLWPTLNGTYSLGALFTGFLLGFVVLTIVSPNYGKFIFYGATFLLYVLWAILQSNLKLAALVLRASFTQSAALRPGIVAVPLTITDPFERTLLASIITLTPGTLSMDLGRQKGQDVLYVHTVDLDNPESFRQAIITNFEQRIRHLHHLHAAISADEEPATHEGEKS